jgi:hypothetical protein
MDQSKKTMRHFYCRDVLWDTFEQMANDFDCSIDYLINEAMRYYARSKNYMPSGASTGGGAAAERTPAPQPHPEPGLATPAHRAPTPMASPVARGARAEGAAARRGEPPPPPGLKRQASPEPPTGDLPAPEPAAMRPSRTPVTEQAGATSAAVLYLTFNNERIPIDKDQFIIGRGSKTSDLAIKDGNISRKHAAVIRRNGVYYIKDLGSTNGIDYKGMRIDNKRIDEGDVFHLCDYELRFSFRG